MKGGMRCKKDIYFIFKFSDKRIMRKEMVSGYFGGFIRNRVLRGRVRLEFESKRNF